MIAHHPAPDILAEYAAGRLHGGAMLAVACHLDMCGVCRCEAALWESAGGALLEGVEPAALSDGALERTMSALGRPMPRRALDAPAYLRRFDLPGPLRQSRIGRRLWVTPNIWFAPIAIQPKSSARTYLVYAKRNTAFPMHTHIGREFTNVLHGSFSDATGAYGPGDFAETDESVTHSPAVTRQSDCLCLSSADAPMRLLGLPARLIQTLVGKLY